MLLAAKRKGKILYFIYDEVLTWNVPTDGAASWQANTVTVFLDPAAECSGDWILSMDRKYLESAMILINEKDESLREAAGAGE